jgi:hypothetical protein
VVVIDRLPTVEKYVVGVKYAAGEAVFDRAASRLRPSPARSARRPGPPKTIDDALVTPGRAARVRVAAAKAGAELTHRMKDMDPFSWILTRDAATLIAWGDHWNDGLPELMADPPTHLFIESPEFIGAREYRHGDSNPGFRRERAAS